jgi:hypothetical protein
MVPEQPGGRDVTRIDEQGKALVGAILGGMSAAFTTALGVLVAYPEVSGWVVLVAALVALFTTASATWTGVYFTSNSVPEPSQAPIWVGPLTADQELNGES